MNILYLTAAMGPDYMADCLALGLRELHGPSFVDYPRLPYLYQDYDSLDHLYGRGFTLYGTLGSDSDVDRTDIPRKVERHFYDLIVYGSVHRDQTLIDLVVSCYKRHEILFIDGEDQTYQLYALAGLGLYFKRELSSPRPGVYPIHFAIPASKIGTCGKLLKRKVLATVDPRDRRTYIFTDEHSYYADYAESLFAITMKKGGWDCLRHLEILANGCLPLFLELDQCPPTTCVHLPKPELLEALSLIDKPTSYWDSQEGHTVWTSLWKRIHLKFVQRCTTLALAKYVMEVQQQEAQRAA